MVSALASSSVGFPRKVSVKVLVSDWDLLPSKQRSVVQRTTLSSPELQDFWITF